MSINWKYGILDDVVLKGSSNISINKVKDDVGKYPLFGAKGFVQNISFFHQDKDYLAIIKDGAGIGRVSKHPKNSSVVATMQYIIPQDGFDIQFIKYFLESLDFEKYRNGSTIPHVYYKDYKNEAFPLLEEEQQKQIVAILDKAFEAIDKAKENLEKNIQNSQELFQSRLNEIFSQKGEGWEEKSLGEVGKVSMCKRILKKQTNSESGIPFYKIGTFGKEANAFISEDIYNDFKNKYSFPKKGDILLSASGTIGRRVVYDGKPAYFQDSNIVWIDNDEKFIMNEYLYEFYGFCNWNPSTGATIARLYNDDLRRIKINYPIKKIQKNIVKELDSLKEQTKQLENHYQQKLQNLEELKKSILQKAFSGELV